MAGRKLPRMPTRPTTHHHGLLAGVLTLTVAVSAAVAVAAGGAPAAPAATAGAAPAPVLAGQDLVRGDRRDDDGPNAFVRDGGRGGRGR